MLAKEPDLEMEDSIAFSGSVDEGADVSTSKATVITIPDGHLNGN